MKEPEEMDRTWYAERGARGTYLPEERSPWDSQKDFEVVVDLMVVAKKVLLLVD